MQLGLFVSILCTMMPKSYEHQRAPDPTITKVREHSSAVERCGPLVAISPVMLRSSDEPDPTITKHIHPTAALITLGIFGASSCFGAVLMRRLASQVRKSSFYDIDLISTGGPLCCHVSYAPPP